MIGIYKITSPSERIYIGQSTNIEKRKSNYEKLKCKGQPLLYRSIAKYGFSAHIFEVVEECATEDLNVRERHWQDLYNVIEVGGLNCKLTATNELKQVHSQKTLEKMSTSLIAFWKTSEGKDARARQVANTDYTSFQQRRVSNMDYKLRTLHLNYIEQSRKRWKIILQYSRDGVFIREWPSVKEAGKTLKINTGNISSCLKGKIQTAGKFIWKYKEI